MSQANGRKALKHRLADRLRRRILAGKMPPGKRLVEDELIAEFKVTRAAVRTALTELTAEGLVERARYRGSWVRVILRPEAIEMYEVRRALESLCARKAAENVTGDQARRLVAIGRSMAAAVSEGDSQRYSQLNERLHTRIRKIAAQTVAQAMLESMPVALVRHRFQLARIPGRPGESLPQHLAIIDAIAGKDPDAAEKAMYEHISDVLRILETREPAQIGS